MTMFRWSSFLLLVVLGSACATPHYTESKLADEARKEERLSNTDLARDELLKILKHDSSITESERNQIMGIVQKGFAEYQQLEVLLNQKKALLMREFIRTNPNRTKIHAVEGALKKGYLKKLDILIDTFYKTSIALKMHPEAKQDFARSVDMVWPMRDRSP